MNGEQVRNTWFLPSRHGVAGYIAEEVDDLVRRVAAELDGGRSAAPLIKSATLTRRKRGSRRDIDAVDWFLGQFLLPQHHFGLAGISSDPWRDLPVAQLIPGGSAALPSVTPHDETTVPAYFAEQCQNAWRDFAQQPGTHLWWGRVGGHKELRTAKQTLASRGSVRETVSAGGRSFTCKGLQMPVRDDTGPFAETWSSRTIIRHWNQFSDDETGIPAVYVKPDNFDLRAGACIKFPDQRWLRFLVRGTRKANAIMTAVDQAGNRVARYKITDKDLHFGWKTLLELTKSVEITLHPGWELTDDLAIALVISAEWLESYFARMSYGG